MTAERGSIDWDEARRLYEEEGWTYAAIARHFGYVPSSVQVGLAERGVVTRRRRTPTGVDQRLRGLWRVVRARCEDPSHSQYRYYGAKGARLCRAWARFEAFRIWSLENGYRSGLRLVRTNRGRPYSPGNCRWVSVEERVRRRKLVGEERASILISAFGETRGAEEWARDRRCKVSSWCLLQRLRRGFSEADAIALPPHAKPSKTLRPGFVAPPTRRHHHIDWDEVRRLHLDQGLNSKKIASRLGYSYSAIVTGLKRRGLLRKRKTAGREEQRLRFVWHGMRNRCTNPDDRQYPDIGGKGYRMCKAWENFERFFEWARSSGARRGLCLTRIDRRKNYTPANCHWLTPEELARSRRAPSKPHKARRPLTAFGECRGLVAWSRDPRCSVTPSTISKRLNLGWRVEEAIADPPARRGCRDHYFRPLDAFHETKGFMDWLRDPRCKIGYTGLWHRLSKGWSVEDAIATPPWKDPVSGARYPRVKVRRLKRRRGVAADGK